MSSFCCIIPLFILTLNTAILSELIVNVHRSRDYWYLKQNLMCCFKTKMECILNVLDIHIFQIACYRCKVMNSLFQTNLCELSNYFDVDNNCHIHFTTQCENIHATSHRTHAIAFCICIRRVKI